jgi:hypothetical protein
MSIRATNLVWERSRAKGTARVVMLALADHARDDLMAYPSLGRLASYANVDRRNVIEAISGLLAAGEIVKTGVGRRGVNIYRITLTSDASITSDDPITSDGSITSTSDESITGTSDAGITRTINEPSFTPQGIPAIPPQNMGSGISKTDSNGDPVLTMVDQWNMLADALGLARVQKLTKTRRTKATARLKDCGGLDGWQVALGKLRAARWMWDGTARGGWKAGFDFLIEESRFVKLMEGGYGHSGAPASGTRGEAINAAWDRLEAESRHIEGAQT